MTNTYAVQHLLLPRRKVNQSLSQVGGGGGGGGGGGCAHHHHSSKMNKEMSRDGSSFHRESASLLLYELFHPTELTIWGLFFPLFHRLANILVFFQASSQFYEASPLRASLKEASLWDFDSKLELALTEHFLAELGARLD